MPAHVLPTALSWLKPKAGGAFRTLSQAWPGSTSSGACTPQSSPTSITTMLKTCPGHFSALSSLRHEYSLCVYGIFMHGQVCSYVFLDGTCSLLAFMNVTVLPGMLQTTYMLLPGPAPGSA